MEEQTPPDDEPAREPDPNDKIRIMVTMRRSDLWMIDEEVMDRGYVSRSRLLVSAARHFVSKHRKEEENPVMNLSEAEFVTVVMDLLGEEHEIAADQFEPMRDQIRMAHDREGALVSLDELRIIMHNLEGSAQLQEKFPLLYAVALGPYLTGDSEDDEEDEDADEDDEEDEDVEDAANDNEEADDDDSETVVDDDDDGDAAPNADASDAPEAGTDTDDPDGDDSDGDEDEDDEDEEVDEGVDEDADKPAEE